MDSDEELEEMKRISDLFSADMTKVNERLLTVADISISKKRNEAILSWRKKNPRLITANVVQQEDDCWAHAHAKGLYAVLKQRKFTGVLPTAQFLLNNIPPKCLTKRKGLSNAMDVAPLLLKVYGCRLIVHHRPKRGLSKDKENAKKNEDFEKFIERRLALAPTAMCFECVPGYVPLEYLGDRKYEVFRPTSFDLAVMKYENLVEHCSVITGRGVEFKGCEWVEFWETYESQGEHCGDGGFTRLERRKRLVTEVYEYQF